MDTIRRIVVAEDHRILRESLVMMLNSVEGLKVVGEAEDGLKAIQQVRSLMPDLLLLDLSLPVMNGPSVYREIKSQYPEIRILVLTMHDEQEHVTEAFKCGVDGYCLKDSGSDELILAVKEVLSGKFFVSPSLARQVIALYLKRKRSYFEDNTPWGMLSNREKEILKMVGEGYKNREIGDYLCISSKTVEKHRSNLMNKLGMHTASALTTLAIEKGLVVKRADSERESLSAEDTYEGLYSSVASQKYVE